MSVYLGLFLFFFVVAALVMAAAAGWFFMWILDAADVTFDGEIWQKHPAEDEARWKRIQEIMHGE